MFHNDHYFIKGFGRNTQKIEAEMKFPTKRELKIRMLQPRKILIQTNEYVSKFFLELLQLSLITNLKKNKQTNRHIPV